MKNRMINLSAAFFIFLFMCLGGFFDQGVAQGADEAAFFKGKVITIVVCTNPGGSYDAYTRLLAPALRRQIPGSTVIVKNVPGGGMITGANEIYKALPDGLTMGTFNIGIMISQLVGAKGVGFDLNKFTWLGNVAVFPRIFAVRTATPYKTVDDIRKAEKPVKTPSSGVGSSAHNDAIMIKQVLGLNMEVIPGYGGAETDMALLRGEVDGRIGGFDVMAPAIDKGDLRPIVIISEKRIPKWSNVPTVSELAPPRYKGVVAFQNAMAEIARPYAAPPNMSAGRAKFLREAFQKALADRELLAMAQKAKMPIDPVPGETVAKLVATAMAQTPDSVDFLKKMVAK